jgi:hypothetical protein
VAGNRDEDRKQIQRQGGERGRKVCEKIFLGKKSSGFFVAKKYSSFSQN